MLLALNEIVAKRNRWSFLKCVKSLRVDGLRWKHRRLHRVYCAMNLNLSRKAKTRQVTRERQSLLTHREVNRVWALDCMLHIMYGGRPFRTLNVIDEGSREALCIECSTSIPSATPVGVMTKFVDVYGQPQAIRLDNWPEMTLDVFVEWAKEDRLRLSFIQPGKPNQNAFIERFNKSFRYEVLNSRAKSRLLPMTGCWTTRIPVT